MSTTIDDIKAYLEELYPTWNFNWKRIGNQIQGLCPFHNDSHKPNLYITDKGNGAFYKCFACGATGKIKNNQDQETDEQKTIKKINLELAKFFSEFLYDPKNSDRALNRQIREYLNERNEYIYDVLKRRFAIGVVPSDFYIEEFVKNLYKTKQIKINFEDLSEEVREKYRLIDRCQTSLAFVYSDTSGRAMAFKFREVLAEDSIRSNKKIYTVSFADKFKNSENAFMLANAILKDDDWPVFIVEGEFDALSAYSYFAKDSAIKIIAAGGLENMYKVAKALVAEEYVPIIIPDFDDAGQEYIDQLTEKCKSDNKSLMNKIFVVKADKSIVDHAKDLDELFKSSSKRATFFVSIKPISLAQQAKELKKQEEEYYLQSAAEMPANLQEIYLQSKNINPTKLEVFEKKPIRVSDVIDATLPPLDFVLPGLKTKTVGIFYAPSGVGKSYLSLEIAFIVAGAKNILRTYDDGTEINIFDVKQHGKVAYLSFEDDEDVLKLRTQKIAKYIASKFGKEAVDNEEVNKNLNIYSLLGSGITVENAEKVVEFCKNTRLTIIDTLSRFNTFEENSNTEMAKFIVELEKIIKQTGTTILILHHITKNKEDGYDNSRGAGAIDSNSRFKCTLTPTNNEDIKIFSIKKTNYGDANEEVYLKKLSDRDEDGNYGGILIPQSTQYKVIEEKNTSGSKKSSKKNIPNITYESVDDTSDDNVF